MCHEGWWRELRARRADESREVWLDHEEPVEPPRRPGVSAEPEPEPIRFEDEAPAPVGTR